MIGQSSQPSRQGVVVRSVIVALFVLLIGLPSLLYPFSRDQGEYAYIASAALEGKIIYRDIFNVKPPLTHIVHQLALLAFGHSMVAIRLLDLLWQSATAVTILLIANKVLQRRGVGVLAAFVYGVWYYSGSYWATAQTDGFLTLPAALSVLAFQVARERERGWAYVACGAALGVAVLFKYPIGALLPLLALLVIRRSGSAGLRRTLQLSLGFAVPLLLCTVELARQGALNDFLLIQTRYIPQYTARHSGAGRYMLNLLRALVAFGRHDLMLWLSAIALALELAYAAKKGMLPRVLPIALWWLAALVSLGAQNKLYAYHALPLLGPQSLIVAHLPFVACDGERVSRPLRLVVIALSGVSGLALLLGYLAWDHTRNYYGLFEVAFGRKQLAAVYESREFSIFGGGGNTHYDIYTELEAARHIESRSTPDETVFIWGFEPTVYFLSHRASASRFIYNYPLYGDFPWPQLREECLARLERDPPRYIVVVRNDQMPWISGTPDDSRMALARFEGLVQLIRSRYRFEALIGDFTLYRRDD